MLDSQLGLSADSPFCHHMAAQARGHQTHIPVPVLIPVPVPASEARTPRTPGPARGGGGGGTRGPRPAAPPANRDAVAGAGPGA